MENKRHFEVMTVNGVNEVITTTTKHAEELVNEFFSNGRSGVELYLHNCEILAELRATKGYLLLGYNSFYSDKGKNDNPLLKGLFGAEADSDTEAKNMCLLATTFGEKQYDKDNNSLDKWVIDKDSLAIMSQLSKSLLAEVVSLKEIEPNKSIGTVLQEIGVVINKDEQGNITLENVPTIKAIREIKALERQFKLPYNEAKVEKAKLDEAAAKVAQQKAEDALNEPQTGTDEPQTDEPQTTTDEPQTTTDEPQTATVDETAKAVEVSLKEAKNLLKVGYTIIIINEQGMKETVFIK